MFLLYFYFRTLNREFQNTIQVFYGAKGSFTWETLHQRSRIKHSLVLHHAF